MNLEQQYLEKLDDINEVLRRNDVLFRLRQVTLGIVTQADLDLLVKLRMRLGAEFDGGPARYNAGSEDVFHVAMHGSSGVSNA